jgi:DNA-binding NarL/FixJ family response regulator
MARLKRTDDPKQSTPQLKGPIKVVLAEPHNLVRAGLRLLFEKVPGAKVVGEINQSRSLSGVVHTHHPHVVIFGVGMGGSDWLTHVAKISADFPALKYLLMATHHGEEYITHLLRAGISGFLLEHATLKELGEALRTVVDGGIYLCRDMDTPAMKNRLKRAKGPANARGGLTSRQRQILEHIAEGKTTKEIAFLLKLSAKTVETHRAHMMERLKIYNIPGLVRYALRMGLISLNS